jgi:uroporphyrinogen decarboxylase
MAEYRAVRARYGFLELCHNAEAAAEVTITAVERLGVDAAIIFADILLVLEPLDIGLEFVAGDGPRIGRPVRSPDDIERLHAYDPADRLSSCTRRCRRVQRTRPDPDRFRRGPLHAGVIPDRRRRLADYVRTKTLMYCTRRWHRLLALLARLVRAYLVGRSRRRAAVLVRQLRGCLSPADYRILSCGTRARRSRIYRQVPVIHRYRHDGPL